MVEKKKKSLILKYSVHTCVYEMSHVREMCMFEFSTASALIGAFAVRKNITFYCIVCFRWLKRGSYRVLAKECAQVQANRLED